MLPEAAKVWIRGRIRKKTDQIFRNYFSRRSIDDYLLSEDGQVINKTPIAQIRWRECRLGHNRIYVINRFKRNKDLFKNNVRDESLANLKGPKHTGLMTDSAMLGIKRAFEKMLVYSEPFMASDFKTKEKRSATMIAWLLTVPFGYGPLKGKTFNQLVSELIKRIGQTYPKFRMYLAKNEYTENGMEHCHLDVNTFIDYYWLHRAWFTILKKQKCFQLWLADHPENDPDHPNFSPKSKDNLVGYRPLWTSSRCVSYLNHYLKKMTQNKVPIKGRVWFQSKYLAKKELPLLQLSDEQQEKLFEAKNNGHVKISNVNLNSYRVDSDGVVSDEVHHFKTLCTIYKQKTSKPILDYLTIYNRNRLIGYRVAARECTEGPSAHTAAFSFKVIYHRDQQKIKVIEGRPPGINPKPDVDCPNIFMGYRMVDKSVSSGIFYNKVEFEKL